MKHVRRIEGRRIVGPVHAVKHEGITFCNWDYVVKRNGMSYEMAVDAAGPTTCTKCTARTITTIEKLLRHAESNSVDETFDALRSESDRRESGRHHKVAA